MTDSSGSKRFLSRRVKRLVVAVVVIGFLFFAVVTSLSGSWSFLHSVSWRSAVDVVEAESRPSNRLRLGVASCNGDPELVLLRESDIDVQVMAVASFRRFRGGYEDCQDAVVVQLQGPLGNRAIVDKHTGRTVNVRRGMSVIEAELRSTDRLTLVINCNTDTRLVLRRETDIDVQVMVVGFAIPSGDGDGCRQVVEYRLKEPLGDRVVIDMHTGLPVKVTAID